MVKRFDKSKKRRVDHLRDRSKLTCIKHGPVNSSYECKLLNCFGTKYSKYRPFKESRQELTTKKTFGKNHVVNYID